MTIGEGLNVAWWIKFFFSQLSNLFTRSDLVQYLH